MGMQTTIAEGALAMFAAVWPRLGQAGCSRPQQDADADQELLSELQGQGGNTQER